MTVRGTFYGDDDNYVIKYTELHEESPDCSVTITTGDGHSVTVVRAGEMNTELTVEKGKRHSCNYETPFGSFLMGISAQKVESKIVDGSGKIELLYTVDFYGNIAGENELTITIKAV